MDTAQKLVSGFTLDLEPLKEPIGFIRVIEWVFAIFAFATTGGYSGTTSLTVECSEEVSKDVTAVFGYPFRLSAYPYTIPSCDQVASSEMYLQGDFSSSAEFFVCVGVFAFLYSTATIILYLGFQNVYRQTSRGPMIDLFVTASFAFLWLVSSSAWGKGLTDIKLVTSPEHLLETCSSCKAKDGPSMGRLNASVIFGFLNLILWAGNCWFIYKETPLHKDLVPQKSSAEATEGPATYSQPWEDSPPTQLFSASAAHLLYSLYAFKSVNSICLSFFLWPFIHNFLFPDWKKDIQTGFCDIKFVCLFFY